MAYSIIETCIGCTACTKKCPVEAITGLRNQLHIIDAELCIDCGACEPACPVSAVYAEDDVPDEEAHYTEINALWFSDKDAARAKVG